MSNNLSEGEMTTARDITMDIEDEEDVDNKFHQNCLVPFQRVKKELRDAQETIANLEKQLEQKQKDLMTFAMEDPEEEIRKIQILHSSQIHDLTEEIKAEKEGKSDLETEHQTLLEDINRLEKDKSANEAEKLDLSIQLAKEKLKIDELQQKLMEHKEKVKTMEDEQLENEQKIEELRKLTQTDSTIEELNALLKLEKEDNKIREDKITNLEQELIKKENNIQTAETLFKQEREEKNSTIAALVSEISLLEVQLAEEKGGSLTKLTKIKELEQ